MLVENEGSSDVHREGVFHYHFGQLTLKTQKSPILKNVKNLGFEEFLKGTPFTLFSTARLQNNYLFIILFYFSVLKG